MAKDAGPAAKRARVQGHPAEGSAEVKAADISIEGVKDIAKIVGDDQPSRISGPTQRLRRAVKSFILYWASMWIRREI